MSELINKTNHRNLRWELLAGVSAAAVLALSSVALARDQDADKPTVWIELGGQLERVQSGEDAFTPPFLLSQPRPPFEEVTSAVTQRPPRYGFGGEAKVTFAPKDSDWSFMADVRFGRSNGAKELHQQTSRSVFRGIAFANNQPLYTNLTSFEHTQTKHAESHAIADFMAGKDVGLGMLGSKGSMTLDFGIRFAQFTSRSATAIHEVPSQYGVAIPQPPNPYFPNLHKYKFYRHHHTYYGHEAAQRSFSGIGPAISLNGSSTLAGKSDAVEMDLDWGANAALLFGRQKVRGDHETRGSYFSFYYRSSWYPKDSYHHATPIARHRSKIVPNLGGFAGLTFRHADAKISFGYRADFFFGAMDEGVDTRHTTTAGFYGPFATVSIGLGG